MKHESACCEVYMSYKFEQGKDTIVNDVVEQVKRKIKGKEKSVCSNFIKMFLGTVALDDLIEWQIDDLYGAMINYWELFYIRKPNETKIRIYNPDFERHGWQTTHTVIEIVHEDMPFLVDSTRMEINRMGLTSHLIIHMGSIASQREKNGVLVAVHGDTGTTKGTGKNEAAILIEIDRQTDINVLNQLHENLDRILQDNRAVVSDWLAMREKLKEATNALDKCAEFVDKNELEESKDFLVWLENHHFTLLGVRDYKLIKQNKNTLLEAIPDTGFGVLRESMSVTSSRNISAMTPEARKLTLSSQVLVISKTNTRSTVHRPIYTDYVGIKQFDAKGNVIGERRVIGLYTSAAYNTSPKNIPFLRHKVTQVLAMSKLGSKCHAGKVLQNILDTLPRDDLFQASPEELLEISMGIFHMQERRRIRLFARKDVYSRFISCLVYVPKERFNTELRQAMQQILCDSFNAIESTFSTRFSDSVLARIHFIIKINPEDHHLKYNFKDIEKKLIEIGRTWNDDLKEKLVGSYGEEGGNQLYEKYGRAFQGSYTEAFSARTALHDIKHVECVTDDSPLGMNFFRPVGNTQGHFRFKVYRKDETIPLSDVLPILENLGLRVISERPYQLKLNDGTIVWINDFSMLYCDNVHLDVDKIKDLFQDAFSRIWFDYAENDGFNQLILSAGIDWREVAMLRTYAKYFKQIRFTFSQEYIESALNNNTAITKKLIELFLTRMSYKDDTHRTKKCKVIKEDILQALDDVDSLDEDKILRRYVDVICATLRTNYFQLNAKSDYKYYLSIKLDSPKIPDMPLPCPMYEIFVCSPRFEGVHLRCGKVARGGLRWSDRPEDFRTEILGLMKAQQVKNAVIVPSGAKGGFIPKKLKPDSTREETIAEGILCYRRFISGLLDLTDNYVAGEVVKPDYVYCYDDDDPYLVVAADKGTATFSDIANEISNKYNFWLGDAFASGGSIGYDHKKMGITARGAWESVKRHFREKGINTQTTDFSVVGIGDMAGDVFGNGMLLSEHICLVGAFNHMHIFIDPTPNAKTSFKERKRLFDLPRSSWKDYDPTLISKGGGVFERSAKSIKITPEIKELFSIKKASVEPNDLIKIMLCSSIDLLWSGGIGTFVKASTESNNDVGDRTNDPIRVDASTLQCKVVGEGGNLGLTQLARVEYALKGGMVYTDFIDNSAGVDCSDNEVNIKILLDAIVANGDLTEKQRNQLLSEMTDEVAKLVLLDNYRQTQAISLAAAQALRNVELHARYIDDLERSGKLNRSLEFIPDRQALMDRKLVGKGLGRPGIAVLLCYSKIILNEHIIDSDVPEDPYLVQVLEDAFPAPLRKRFNKEMQEHQLRREIIATKLSNLIINEMGFTFIYRLQDETGASTAAIVRAYMVVREIFQLSQRWNEIQQLDNVVSADEQINMMMQYIRLLRRSTRWFLRTKRLHLDIKSNVELYASGIIELKKTISKFLEKHGDDVHHQFVLDKTSKSVPKNLAHEIALGRPLFSALDIIDISHAYKTSISKVAEVYFGIGKFLDLKWIRTQVIVQATENHWESLSREALRDDLDWQQKQLTTALITSYDKNMSVENYLTEWSNTQQELIARWQYMLADLKAAKILNFLMYFVAIRELLDLTQTTLQSTTEVEC